MENVTVTYNTVSIKDSYKVHKCKMRKTLKEICNECDPGDTCVFDRSFFSLTSEWIVHNFCYMIGYKRDHTKDVDLDNPCDRPEWQYIICRILVGLFVW